MASLSTRIAPASTGPYGPFASPNQWGRERPLDKYEVIQIFDYLDETDLGAAEDTCKAWKRFIIEHEDQWRVIQKPHQWGLREQCRVKLNIPFGMDPRDFFPLERRTNADRSVVWSTPANYTSHHVRSLRTPKIFDHEMYRKYLGVELGPMPPTPLGRSLSQRKNPDPVWPFCIDLSPLRARESIGESYCWLDINYVDITCGPEFQYVLDREDDPNNPDAPRLIPGEVGPETRVLRAYPTLNNVEVLFKNPKIGQPSGYDQHSRFVDNDIFAQHGDKRITPGRYCIGGSIDVNGSFPDQQAAAAAAGVEISPLGPLVIFIFFIRICSKRETHPFVGEGLRTSTVTDVSGRAFSTICGRRGFDGFNDNTNMTITLCRESVSSNNGTIFYFQKSRARAAVVLPAEVPAPLP